MPVLPDLYWEIVAFTFGAVIGSFLNVVIWRLPRGESLVFPGSHCPHCNHELSAWENVPLFSYLLLGRRCRHCKGPISSRYFWVELLTASLFVLVYLQFGATAYTVVFCVFAASLVAALFIDAQLFIIPDEINVFALLIGIGWDIWCVCSGTRSLLWGWLPRSIAGAMICASVFVVIQVVGLALFRKDAMGDGDVKLARAIGAMLPLGQALVSFLLAIGAGAVLGGALLIWARVTQGPEEAAEADVPDAEDGEEPTTFGETLVYGALYATMMDLVLMAAAKLGIRPAQRVVDRLSGEEMVAEEDEFVPGPTYIPFGPYMVVGAIAAAFVGDRLIQWYLVWAHLSPLGR